MTVELGPRGAPTILRPQDRWPVGAAAFILAVSAAWWGFALFAVPGAPEWLDRARAVCFNITESGLPDAKGWLLLIGQPPAMLLALYAGWSGHVRDTCRHLARSPARRRLIVGAGLAVAAFLATAAAQVASLRLPPPTLAAGFGATGDELLPETYPRLDRPWPGTEGLVDQLGAAFALESLGGRPAFVTFAFGHCATICPIVVRNSLEARRSVESQRDADAEMAVVVFTLDPWRDTPSRLPVLAERYGLDPARDFMVGGAPEAVTPVLDAFAMAHQRDPRTGDVVHPPLVYVAESDGTLAYASTGATVHLVELAGRTAGRTNDATPIGR